MLASIVIRTYNEEKHLEDLLQAANNQISSPVDYEVVLVDSGSTDRTLEIAEKYNCRIVHIDKSQFTFGRSLNMGCDYADGDILVFISGHCIPTSNSWLNTLVRPILEEKAVYTYGRQIGADDTKFSEHQVFEKYYPKSSLIPQEGYFCNNANAALLKAEWKEFPFCEELTGLEDMHMAKSLVDQGKKIAYVAEAPVYHIHNENWKQVKLRYEREAIALQKIMPEVHVSFKDFLHYLFTAIFNDFVEAKRQGVLLKNIKDIMLFRLMQFWGSYKGNQRHRELSAKAKFKYFYPNNKENPK